MHAGELLQKFPQSRRMRYPRKRGTASFVVDLSEEMISEADRQGKLFAKEFSPGPSSETPK